MQRMHYGPMTPISHPSESLLFTVLNMLIENEPQSLGFFLITTLRTQTGLFHFQPPESGLGLPFLRIE